MRAIFERCKHDWHYLVPEAEHERSELRGLCQQMLAFENEFLQQCDAPIERYSRRNTHAPLPRMGLAGKVIPSNTLRAL